MIFGSPVGGRVYGRRTSATIFSFLRRRIRAPGGRAAARARHSGPARPAGEHRDQVELIVRKLDTASSRLSSTRQRAVRYGHQSVAVDRDVQRGVLGFGREPERLPRP